MNRSLRETAGATLALLGLLASGSARGQGAETKPAETRSNEVTSKSPDLERPGPRVLSATCEDGASCDLHSTVVVTLSKGAAAALGRASDGTAVPLGLYLAGRFIKDIAPVPSVDNPDKLAFSITRTDGNRVAIADALGGHALSPHALSVSVGPEKGPPAHSEHTLEFKLLRGQKPVLLAFFLAALLLMFLVLALWTPLLRDPGTAQPDAPGWRRYGLFSLARTQMAVWFVAVVEAFLAIWMLTGATDSLTSSCLALLGIGAGTALGAALVDGSKSTASAEERNRLTARRVAQDQELQALVGKKGTPEEIAAKQAALAETDRALAALPRPPEPAPSHGLADLLTDANGYSLHRVQMAVWTVVLQVLFWASVSNRLLMPEFDSTLLALMGISSGTYLGFKLPERAQ